MDKPKQSSLFDQSPPSTPVVPPEAPTAEPATAPVSTWQASVDLFFSRGR